MQYMMETNSNGSSSGDNDSAKRARPMNPSDMVSAQLYMDAAAAGTASARGTSSGKSSLSSSKKRAAVEVRSGIGAKKNKRSAAARSEETKTLDNEGQHSRFSPAMQGLRASADIRTSQSHSTFNVPGLGGISGGGVGAQYHRSMSMMGSINPGGSAGSNSLGDAMALFGNGRQHQNSNRDMMVGASNSAAGFSMSPTRVPFPRAPLSPSALAGTDASASASALALPSSLMVDDFSGANANLRRSLANLQRQQQQQNLQQQQQNQQSQQQQAASGLQLQLQMQRQRGAAFSMAMDASDSTRNAMLNPDMLMMGSNGSSSGSNLGMNMNANQNATSNSGGMMGSGGGGAQAGQSDNFLQLQFLRQQQERIRHLEQLEQEEMAMLRQRQQLQMFQNANNSTSSLNNRNSGNANSVLGFDSSTSSSSGAWPVVTGSSSFMSGGGQQGSMMDSFNESNFLLQQRLQQQQQQQQDLLFSQQQSNLDLYTPQQQAQFMASTGSLPGVGGLIAEGNNMDSFVGSMGDSSSFPSLRAQAASNSNQASNELSGVGSSRGATNRRSSGGGSGTRPISSSGSGLPRAKPILGPVASPVPPPPFIPESNYLVPPIDEGETPHYSQRLHCPLAIEEDCNWLSEFQCFVRKELLQVFRASNHDVKVRVASKKVFYKQVGIRCRFCAHCKPSTRAIRSSAFPTSIRQLYQSFTMMLRDHFGSCTAIPDDLKHKFLELKRNNTQGAADSMRYWIYSAVKLGMVDSDCGIVLNEQTQAAARSKPFFGTAPDNVNNSNIFAGATDLRDSNADSIAMDDPPRLLVKPEDQNSNLIASEFLYKLLMQYQLVRLRSTECIGNRKSLRPGIPGLGCRYCCAAGRMGLSRIFPAKKKQLSTNIQEMFDHNRRCNLCPSHVKEELKALRELRDSQRPPPPKKGDAGEKDGGQKIVDDDDRPFLELLWQRLGHRGELATPIG